MFLMPLTRDDYKEYNWSLKVNSDISKDMKLMLSGSTGDFIRRRIMLKRIF